MTPSLHERETLGSGNNRVIDGLIEGRDKAAVADADPCNCCGSTQEQDSISAISSQRHNGGGP